MVDEVESTVRDDLRLAHEADSLPNSIRFAEQALEQAQKIGELRSVAIARRTLMFSLYRHGQKAQVSAMVTETADGLLASGLEAYCGEVLRWGGLCALDVGRMDEAISWATQSYEISERLNDDVGRVLAYSLLGGAFDRVGDPWHGEMLLKKGLHFARELGKPLPLMVTLNNLCAVMIGKYYMLRDGAGEMEARQMLHETEPLAREAADIAVAVCDPFYEAFTEGNLGEVLVHVGQLDEAKRRLDHATRLGETHQLDTVISRVRCSCAELALRLENYSETLRLVDVARGDTITVSSPSTMLRVEFVAYVAHRRLGQYREALEAFEGLRRIESEHAAQQLHARSQVMLTRLEAQESERRGLARANAVASAHAARVSVLERAAYEDELTGIANRRALDQHLMQVLQASERLARPCSLAMIDVDHFKQINDDFGHAAGDNVLQRMSRMLRSYVGDDVFVARIGGEEFVIFVDGRSAADLRPLMERVRLEISEYTWRSVAPDLKVTVSIGVASAPPYSAELLLERADFAMYRAKRSGRNRVVVGAQ
ncbi:MAG: GGDEF domain-containing protein [Betaproteobacteria bacterium]|nr:MAG: GGDEF domain-containing protein [Betaproteobacteria bacterium]